MDPFSILTSAKTSLESAYSIIKVYQGAKETFDEIERKSSMTDLMMNIVDAKNDIVELKSILVDKDEVILQLKNELKQQKELTYKAPVYWHIQDDKKDGPFCQKCYDDTKKLARLQVHDISHDGAWNCTICSAYFSTKEYEQFSSNRRKSAINSMRINF